MINLNDNDRGVDLSQAAQGHVSQRIKQIFTVKRSRIIRHKEARIEAREEIQTDQFGNLYVFIAAKLFDGEMHSVTAWMGAEKWTGTEKKIVLVKPWKKFKRFDDSCLEAVQTWAFLVLAQANLAILKGRHAGKLPFIG